MSYPKINHNLSNYYAAHCYRPSFTTKFDDFYSNRSTKNYNTIFKVFEENYKEPLTTNDLVIFNFIHANTDINTVKFNRRNDHYNYQINARPYWQLPFTEYRTKKIITELPLDNSHSSLKPTCVKILHTANTHFKKGWESTKRIIGYEEAQKNPSTVSYALLLSDTIESITFENASEVQTFSKVFIKAKL
ncbi:MAG: hypothetical protein JHC93_00155 [Parachlamydiales bacterium]|nr:hypothetical protein [Parachlamydiales bacterium]